jgi:hypothetical protein
VNEFALARRSSRDGKNTGAGNGRPAPVKISKRRNYMATSKLHDNRTGKYLGSHMTFDCGLDGKSPLLRELERQRKIKITHPLISIADANRREFAALKKINERNREVYGGRKS